MLQLSMQKINNFLTKSWPVSGVQNFNADNNYHESLFFYKSLFIW